MIKTNPFIRRIGQAIAIVSALYITPIACAAEDKPADIFTGSWVNDSGSMAAFAVQDGVVSGHYRTNVGEPENSETFPILGQIHGGQIVFTVNFTRYSSMTAWVGQLTQDETGKPYIRTMWQNTKNVPDAEEIEEIWGSIRTGASRFYRKSNSIPIEP